MSQINQQLVKSNANNGIIANDVRRHYSNSPFGLLDEMNDVFDSLFNTDLFFNNRLAVPLSALSTRSHSIKTDDDKLEISIDLPGVKSSDMDVSIQGNEVTVSATRGDRQQTYQYLVGQDYDAASPKAHLEDGVLTLSFDKRPEAKPRKVEVVVKRK